MKKFFQKLRLRSTRDIAAEETQLMSEPNLVVDANLSIPGDYYVFDVSKDKKFMAVLTKDWELTVYTLKHTNDGIKYVGNPARCEVKEIDSIQNYYMYLSVASKTGDVAISFAELENHDTPLFTTKTPQQVCRYCLIYSKKSIVDKSYVDELKKIEFQGRAVYVEDKLVLIGENILEVRYADTLKLKYFLDLNDLKKGFEALLAGETFVKQATWAKYFPTRPAETNDNNNNAGASTGSNDAENTNRMINDGDKLILMTRHIHSNTLVTNYRGNIVRVWSILDGSLLVSLATEETEYVMAISDDQRFVATYEEKKKKVNVYCTKSNLLLHTYVPQEKQTDRSSFSVTCVRFYSCRPYIIIAGVITKEPEPETIDHKTPKAFYEVWSISQERLIQSVEEPGICDKALQPFVMEPKLDFKKKDEEDQTNSQPSNSTEQNSQSSSNESESNSNQPVSDNNSGASGSNDIRTVSEINSSASGSKNTRPISESSRNSSRFNSPSSNLESTIRTSGSSTSQSTANNSTDTSGSNHTEPDPKKSNKTDKCDNKTSKSTVKNCTNKEHIPLYGVFAKINGSNIEFGRKLVFEYNREPAGMKPKLNYQINWQGFPFQLLGGEVLQHKPLSDICEPLDGTNTLGYILDRVSRVYLLRFGTHMVQLWQLTAIPKGKIESAKKAGHVFNFKDVPRSSAAEYYNTIEHSQLKFARAYKGYHNDDDFSSFRDVWKSYGSNIRFMKDIGHIVVDIKKFPKTDKSATEGNQMKDTSGNREKSWFEDIDTKIRTAITSHPTKQPETITEDEFFLSLSRNESSKTDYDFCEIESAFQALHHLDYATYPSTDKNYRKDVFEANKEYLYEKISAIINKALESPKCMRYFSTFSGSRTLVLLASTENGQKLLLKILCNEGIPINVFSYMRPGKLKENVLTVLMEKRSGKQPKYDLFNLMFNKILIDYYQKGSGNLSAIMDALLFLQEANYTSQLLMSTKKLSFLPVKAHSAHLLDSELVGMLSIKGLQQEDTYRVEYLDTFSGMEQIERYNHHKWYRPLSYFLYYLSLLKRSPFMSLLSLLLKTLYSIIFGNSRIKSDLAELCIVPLPYFNSYRSLPEEKKNIEGKTKKHKQSTETKTFNSIQYYKYSPFALLASSVHENSIFKQGDTVMEMLVSYKWETFAKSRFYLILFCHSVYYVSYSTGVSFPEELFGYVPGTRLTNPSHIAAIVFMFISGSVLLIQEFRQFLINKLDYFNSFYNYIDLAAFILPVTTFALLCTRSPDSTVLYSVSSVTTLILWMHMILRLRVFRPFGTLLEIIIQLVGNVFPVIIIMILVVMGFTNAIVVLLRRKDDSFFQDQLGPPGSDDPSLGDQSQQNNFKDIFLSYTTVWLFIFGYFDPVFDGDVGNYTMSIILVVLFSFIVVLILFNVVIALMSGKIDKIIEKGNKIWISHFAAVVSEIELLWVFDSTKFSKKNNPTHIYYNANVETIRSHHANIVKENEDLKEKIEKYSF